jgi:hypothetical protein
LGFIWDIHRKVWEYIIVSMMVIEVGGWERS